VGNEDAYGELGVELLLRKGDGSFWNAVSYPTTLGAGVLVSGDFNQERPRFP
jgi:hypothetical protein